MNSEGASRPHAPIVLIALCSVLVATAPYFALRGWDHAHKMWPTNITDFDVFYDAGRLVLSDQRSHLYDVSYPAQGPSSPTRSIGVFVNPPAEALLFSPLTLLPFRDARSWFAIISVIALVAMTLLAIRGRSEPVFVLAAAAAVVSFLPLYDAIYLGHSPPVYALFIACSLAALLGRRDALGGAATGLLALKPTLLVFPMLALAIRRRRAFAAAAITAVAVGFGPFLLTGGGSFADHLDLLWHTRGDVFRLHSRLSDGAALMFNWNGFFSRLLTEDPPSLIVTPLSLLSGLIALKAMFRRNLEEGYLAATLASLVAVPHMLNYDWPVLLPAGLVVAARTRDPILLGLLIVLDLSVNLSMLQHWTRSPADPSLMIVAPVGLAVMAYLAFWPAPDEVDSAAELGRLSQGAGGLPATA